MLLAIDIRRCQGRMCRPNANMDMRRDQLPEYLSKGRTKISIGRFDDNGADPSSTI